MESIISVKDVSFRYDKEEDKQTIKQVSFDIFDQEWVAIIGHNGSGKSTMAKLIDGLLEAESGQITVAGLTLNEANVWTIRQNIGLVFQNPDNQFVGATVEDDVAFGLENAGVPHDEMVERVNWALDEVGMSRRISKPGLRVYAKSDEIPKVLNGLGIAIVSTSEGVVTDKEARQKNIGGEILAYVW
ncbi:30S ribosomal protein S8 [Aerococcus urinae]